MGQSTRHNVIYICKKYLEAATTLSGYRTAGPLYLPMDNFNLC